jgi:hypothetical protein
MPKSKRKQVRRGRQRKSSSRAWTAEWVGGRLTLPLYVTEAEPFRPEVVLWLELPDDFVVGQQLIDPNGPPLSFGETLLQAMASPLVGPPRRPKRVRVADPHLAMELRRAVSDIEIVVAPTPELDALIAQMLASMPEGAGSGPRYLENGRITADAVASLFRAAEALFRAAPWKLAQDSQVLRLDIPALGVAGACVSIIGALGESLGLIIFPSHLAMERFLAGIDTRRPRGEPLDMGTTTISLNFERGADLPLGMRREVAEHGWPVAAPSAYPWVQHRDRDGTMRPLEEQDVRVAAACASGIAAFFASHREHWEQVSGEGLSEVFAGPEGVEIRLTVPYEAPGSPVSGAGPLRKEVSAARGEVAQSPPELHELDGRLIETMMEFAGRRFGEAWPRAARGISERPEAIALLAPFLVYQVLLKGKPVARWFMQENDRRLSDTERAWLRAQHAAWLSMWEVRGAEVGHGLELQDLLTGEVRKVRETGASKTLSARQVILARVVDLEDLSLLCGCHGRALPPREAADVVKHARTPLRRRGTEPKNRLREEKMGRYLIARWEEAVDDLEKRRVMLPRLQNTDGEDLLLTVDRFELDPSLRSDIEAALGTIEGIEGAQPPRSGEGDGGYLFKRAGNPRDPSWQGTILGSARIGGGELRVETNSVERADRIRGQIEAACGKRIRHRTREHSDPLARMGGQEPASSLGGGEILPTSEDANALILDFKRQHYADWPDQPLPALGGNTPLAAVRTKSGREKVDLLLKEFEAGEARLPEGQRFDFSHLRRELGLLD